MTGPVAKSLAGRLAACVTVYVTEKDALAVPTTMLLPLLTFMLEKVTSGELPAACAAGATNAERARAPETAATVARMRMNSPVGKVGARPK
ncbi:hypothetical protein GCM10011578_041690 [Streptomyces fuscichromogenes]|uniref:Uncharacterized protein n=1 Tax=Streptomyces fuscichromogenes TaxID=1324013 RepID=A0A918CSI3_9ACTN|nr:hypothetical protein GCM10011578_041690 [Streptomyces fuscichromogenes]